MEFTFSSSSGCVSSMVMETCLAGEAIIRATVITGRTTSRDSAGCLFDLNVSELTFGGPRSLCSDDVRVTSELLQRRDGALTHHRLPAKRTVIDDLQHYRRSVHLVLWKELHAGCEEGDRNKLG